LTLAYAVSEPAEGAARRASRTAAAEAAGLAGLGILLFAVSVLAVQFTRFEALTAIWPTNAMALIAVMRSQWSRATIGRLLAVVAVALAAPLALGGAPAWAVIMITLGNLAEVMLAAWLVRMWVGKDSAVTGLGPLAKLLLAAAIIAPALQATITAPVFAAIPDALGHVSSIPKLWLDSFTADALGMMLIAPFGLALRLREVATLTPKRWVEAAAIWAFILAAALWVFGHGLWFGPHHALAASSDLLKLILLTPLLILASLRFGVLGAAGAALTVGAVALGFTVAGEGPLADLQGMDAQAKIYWLQLYLAVVGLSTLPVAAVLRDRDAFAGELARHRRRAEAASEGKSRLLANVSHEIKSPVGGIIGIGELWASGKLGPITPMQEEMSEMLVRTARQIEALAYDLLDVARAEAGSVAVNLCPVELLGAVEDVKRAMAVKPEAAGLKWSIEAPVGKLVARADSVRLGQVLNNLVTNAVKYGRSGGVVILKLSRPSPDIARIEVIDRGPGIPREKQAELFEPFNRLGMEKTTVEGHGIGLALARRLAELQDGALGFESKPGEGARFWIDLRAVG
jgi:signal transduction histidine kinase